MQRLTIVPLHLVPLTMLGCFNPILGKIWTKMAVFILPKIGEILIIGYNIIANVPTLVVIALNVYSNRIHDVKITVRIHNIFVANSFRSRIQTLLQFAMFNFLKSTYRGAVVNDTLELWEDKAFSYTHPTPLILPKRIHTPQTYPNQPMRIICT